MLVSLHKRVQSRRFRRITTRITDIGIGNTENPSSNGTYGHGYTTFDISANFWSFTQTRR